MDRVAGVRAEADVLGSQVGVERQPLLFVAVEHGDAGRGNLGEAVERLERAAHENGPLDTTVWRLHHRVQLAVGAIHYVRVVGEHID